MTDNAQGERRSMPRAELINRVRAAAARGLSYAQTAEELGITKNAVAGLAARNCIRFGLSPLFWSDDEVDQLEQLIEAGFSPVEIARRMSRSASAIRWKARDLGASWRSANRTHANDNYKAPVTLPRLKFLENAKKEAA